jgi:hypothetical protein
MARVAWLLAIVVVVASAAPCAAQPSPRIGTQRVLLELPSYYMTEEFLQMLQEFVTREADIYVTTVDMDGPEDLSALRTLIPDRFFDLQTGISGGPRVTLIKQFDALQMEFDKMIVLGGGWYDEYYADSMYTELRQPDYAPDLYSYYQRHLENDGILGVVGSAIYTLVLSGVLPPGACVSAYPCDGLVAVITDAGYKPIVMELNPRPDGSWPPLVEVEPHIESVGCGKAAMLPAPNTWYGSADGPMYETDYGIATTAFVQTIEDTCCSPGPACRIRTGIAYCGRESGFRLWNETDNPIDLGGWRLQFVDWGSCAVGYEHTLESVVLQPGEMIQYFAGDKPSSNMASYQFVPIEHFFGENGDKRVLLVDPNGILAAVIRCTEND